MISDRNARLSAPDPQGRYFALDTGENVDLAAIWSAQERSGGLFFWPTEDPGPSGCSGSQMRTGFRASNPVDTPPWVVG